MIPCTVTVDRCGFATVRFDAAPHRSLFLQSEDDVKAFAEHCGATVDTLEDVTECPAEYHDISDLDDPPADKNGWDEAFRRYKAQRGL